MAELRALPLPEAERGRLDEVFSLMEQQTDVLRQIAAAAAGDAAAVRGWAGSGSN
jgi:hypothetical protein